MPKLNGSYIVIFPFTNWEPGGTFKNDYSKSIIVKGVLKVFGTENSLLLKYTSKNRAAVSLGIPKTTFYRYVNLKNYSVYSPVLDMDVFLIEKSQPLTGDVPCYTFTSQIISITGVDLDGL